MLSWLRRWWSRDHRSIYRFNDGVTTRRADPLVIAREVERLCPQYTDLFGLLVDDHSFAPAGAVREDLQRQQKEALAKLVAVARQVFRVPADPDPLIGFALTESQSFGLLAEWLLWMAKAGEEARPFSILQPRASPSTPDDSPTGTSVVSGTGEGK